MRRSDGGRSEIHSTYVYAASHSGTTILYKLLALHPDFAWFSQFSHRNGAIAGELDAVQAAQATALRSCGYFDASP